MSFAVEPILEHGVGALLPPVCHLGRWLPGPGGGLLAGHPGLSPQGIHGHLQQCCQILIGEVGDHGELLRGQELLDLGGGGEVIHGAGCVLTRSV